MKNVVLIDPSYSGVTEEFNAGILSIGSYLESKGYKIKIFFTTEDMNAIDSHITDDTYFVGLSVMTTQLPEALRVIRHIKLKNPNTKILLGGYHTILYPEQSIKHKLVDFICTREGEELCEELIEVFEGKREIKSIKGLGYKKNGEIFINEPRADLDIIKLPRMNYSLVHNFRGIPRKLHDGTKVKTAWVYAGKGCPFLCTFCINSVIGKKWQGRDVEQILDEIEWLIKNHDVSDIVLVDELFFVRRKRFFKFLEGIEERNLKFSWFAHCRAGYVNDNYLTLDILKRMKRLGCTVLSMGIESGSERMLKKMQKGMTTEQAINAVKTISASGITPKVSFIVGFPDESEDDLLRSFKLMVELHRMAPELYIVGPNIFRPYPGGILYDEIVNSGVWTPCTKLEDWKIEDSGWNDRFMLDSSPWIEHKDLALDIKDTINAFIRFKNEVRFKLAWFILSKLYHNPKLMQIALKNLPYLNPTARTIFRPNLPEIYESLQHYVEDIDLNNYEMQIIPN